MTRSRYDETSITAFKRDLEKIRSRPAMYVGPVDSDGVFTVLRECLDNAVDEARAGRNDLIQVYVDKGQFTVIDHGVGIPVAKHPVMKISTLTHVLTNLQSSGKMKKGAYESAIGTHGVGIKGTNALSSNFMCWTYRKDSGGWHSTSFKQGRETQPVKKCRPPKIAGKSIKSGTVIQFTPDPDIFGKHQLDMKRLTVWAEMTAYMNAGLTIQVFHNGKMRQWFSKKGVQEYLAKRMKELSAEPFNKTPLHHTSHTLDLCLNFTNAEGEQVEFFTNTVRNADRGIHADAMFKALVDAIEPYKGARQHFTPTDLREGLVGVLNYKVTAPQFSSQTKDKLVDIRVKEPCYNECLKVFESFFKVNKTFTKELCARAAQLRERTADFLKDKKLIKEVNSAKKTIGTKLADVSGKRPPGECELFIVEGESAGGGAKRARDKSFQAIYPLRGKPLNVMEADAGKVNSNKEVVGLLAALGVELGKKGPPTVRYGKVIAMADPDVDGSHINCLCLAILWRYMPHLFKQGVVHVVRAPLYKCWHKGKLYFGMKKETIAKRTGVDADKLAITYIKGWGEISENELDIALSPDRRILYRVNGPDKNGANEFRLLMGKDSAYRKELFGVQ